MLLHIKLNKSFLKKLISLINKDNKKFIYYIHNSKKINEISKKKYNYKNQ
jgi:hypothetical protein